MEIYDFYKVLVVVMLFYSFGVTLILYATPDDAKHFISQFSDVGADFKLDAVTANINDGFAQQKSAPVVDVGTLVFYTGNVVVDILSNFVFAIPQMIGLLTNAIVTLIGVDRYIVAIVEIFAASVMTALYIAGLIQLLTGLRTGSRVV